LKFLNLFSSFSQVIVIGTGLEESIVAAAAARNGHTVLHIDINDYYGSEWSAFTFDGLQKWAAEAESEPTESKQSESEDLNSFLKDGESLIVLDPRRKSSFKNVQQKWFVPPHVEEPEPEPEPEKEAAQTEKPLNETDDEKAASQNPENVPTKDEDQKIEPKVEVPKKPVFDQVKVSTSCLL
jgi:Rab proteins geranylgeranyltransferase component A